MSYHQRPTRRALAGITSQPPMRFRPPRGMGSLGSLGADEGDGGTTLSAPTVQDPTGQWQAQVLAQLQSGVDTMKLANTQKWLQIIATVSIPLSAFMWNAIFPRLRKRFANADPTT